MTEETNGLLLHGKHVRSVFDLLGKHENDMTRAVGWTLSRSPVFLKSFVAAVVPGHFRADNIGIALQVRGQPKGYTDVELTAGTDFHLIVEAKLGWQQPRLAQLEKYAARLRTSSTRFKS